MALTVLLVVFGFFAVFSLVALLRDEPGVALIAFMFSGLISIGVLAYFFPS